MALQPAAGSAGSGTRVYRGDRGGAGPVANLCRALDAKFLPAGCAARPDGPFAGAGTIGCETGQTARCLSNGSIVAVEPLSLRCELRDTLKLAGPIVVNQVGHMSMGVVDTLVAGHISTVALAGLGLGANLYWTAMSMCAGCLMALDTYFSQAIGAKDNQSLRRYLQQAFWSCAIVATASFCLLATAYLAYMNFAAAGPTQEAFGRYIRIIIWTLPSLFPFVVLQRYWQAR